MTALSVNLNKVALLRNARTTGIPSVAHAAELVLEAGADGVTVHPRPDGRHVRGADVVDIAAVLERWPRAEFNIEGNPFHELLGYVRDAGPDQCTFVPDEATALTSDHGWDLRRDGALLKPLVDLAHAAGARVSLFMDPIADAMAIAREIGADRVELYTEPYARAYGTSEQAHELARHRVAAEAAIRAGLGVNAGHDLNRRNLATFLSEVPGVQEVSIGHAFIADALEFGLARTVHLYLEEIRKAGTAPTI
jgi:pyridoxine 5-phosphate synthase